MTFVFAAVQMGNFAVKKIMYRLEEQTFAGGCFTYVMSAGGLSELFCTLLKFSKSTGSGESMYLIAYPNK